ncbi:MAG TPA: 4-(cytidine 5'-diphospho)-2-C-methyl-D-erythritol kinase [Candidatus Dormibacteraeota bacterium]|nr:4-(cytidine 5'-diphospho)-2-C-methyl-D-erythritol kinase [Candidatus Dormibacteraeota bacterium]
MLLLAPAKLNLTLEVLSKRPNGFHGVRSLMLPVALFDELKIERAPKFSFTCDDPSLSNAENLVVRAAHALALHGVHIHLCKRIPIQAGLGGGSSDAAALLRAGIAGLFGRLPQRDWIAQARALGSDVPFFLADGAALVEGSGERITAAGALPPWCALIVKPPIAISTAQAYHRFDERAAASRPRKRSASIDALTALGRGEFTELNALLYNDFHDDAIAAYPEIERAAAAMERAGAPRALLAGSGSSLFALLPTAQRAQEVAEQLDLPAPYLRFTAALLSGDSWRK